MVGTGAAATADAVALTRHAAELGFAGALVLPPFYYKGVPDDGLVAYVDDHRAGDAPQSRSRSISIISRRSPACPGTSRWSKRLLDTLRQPHRRPEGFLRRHGLCARGGRRSRKHFDVFPSTEAVLLEARTGAFAGCISATANLNADLCQRAWATATQSALDAAVTIRKLFDGKALVSGVKALLAHIHGDPGWRG